MFVHYHGTKAGFISKGYSETYKNCIVFIKGGSDGKGECIYTHGNYFANFKELISTLCFFKGVVVDGTAYNTVQGGGYLEIKGKDPATVEVSVSSGGIEIGLSEDFKDNISDIEQTLVTISSDYLKNEDKKALENLISGIKTEILGEVSDDYNSLSKIEQKIKNLRETLKVNDITNGLGTEVENTSGTIKINISTDDESIKINKDGNLFVNSVDGGLY
jgi:hypothetical protein